MTVVDIHCHTFNGADLPVEGFVKHVSLRDKKLPDWAKGRLARRADRMVQREQHGYDAERRILDALLDASALGLAVPDDVLVEPGPPFDEQVTQDVRDLIAEDPATAALLGAQSVSDGFSVEPADVRAFFEFARNLASTRVAIARRLVATYPTVNVFTPMLVDMSYGVDDRPMTSVAEQIDLHEKVSRLSILGKLTSRDALLLPFVGFDPRRAVERAGALELVQDAVEHKGFAGVKMYPPMGFSPIGNAEPGVDDVLTTLYTWCERECVPLTVHCNRTQGAKSEINDSRSDPRLWAEVLAKHPSLHLNLGHFGGIRRFGKVFWPEEISRLASYDHVYADLGCHADLLGQAGRTAYKSVLDELFADSHRPMRERLMYGSDWSMLLQHPGADEYLDAVLTVFPEDEHAQFAGGRALDFLGLGATPNKNGQRILDRIRQLGGNPSTWLG